MAAQHKDDQAEPFLADGRPSDDVELSNLGLDGQQMSSAHDHDRTPDSHYHHSKVAPVKARGFALLVGAALFITVIGFVINTEATEYFESELGWKKPLASMYVTHSSLILPWIVYAVAERIRHRNVSFGKWAKQNIDQLSDSITAIAAYQAGLSDSTKARPSSPLKFLFTTMGLLTIALTASGMSWFIALAWTTPADLTAIYNCSTFFAAAFSVPLLKERLGLWSIVAVGLSIVGTFVIAYGDTTAKHDPTEKIGTSRLFGNIIACVGALAFGLYEVLFKKWACSSQPLNPQQSLPLTLFASALTGFYTLVALWPGLLAAHFAAIEPFVWPSARTWLWIVIAVLSGSVSITLLAVLVVWTDPVFGSFANVLSVFFVALSDWLIFGLSPSLATYFGGGLVIVAFSLLTWDTFVAPRKGRPTRTQRSAILALELLLDLTLIKQHTSMPGVPTAVQQGGNTTALLYLKSRIDKPKATVSSPSLRRTLSDPRYATPYFPTAAKAAAIIYAYTQHTRAGRRLMQVLDYDLWTLQNKMIWWTRQIQWLSLVWSLTYGRDRIAGHLFRDLIEDLVKKRRTLDRL